MPTRLTERAVREMDHPGPAVRDTEVRGLMVLRNRRSKSYALQTDLWRCRARIRTVRMTLGRTDRMTLREARSRAREVLAAISRGEDPPPRRAGAA